MDKLDKEIGEQIRRIAGTAQGRQCPAMSGVVMSVDDGGTCTVQLTADAQNTPTDGILLNVLLENTNGMYLVPAVNAHCVVGEVDGPGQLKQLLWASSYTQVQVTVGSSVVNVVDGTIKAQVGSDTALTITDGQMDAKVSGTELTMTSSGFKMVSSGYSAGALLNQILTLLQGDLIISTSSGDGQFMPTFIAELIEYQQQLQQVIIP